MSLTGGRWWAENTPLGYPSPLTGKHERYLWYHKGQLSLLANVGVGEGSVTGWL